MQNNKQIPNTGEEEVLSLVEDVLNLVVATLEEEAEEESNGFLTVVDIGSANEVEIEEEEECADTSDKASVCDGYDADYDNEDNDTVICSNEELDHDIDDDGYHSNPKPLKFGSEDKLNPNCDSNLTDNCVKKWIAVGNTVLSRWTDGLFYMGLIVQIDSKLKKCLIRFEDSSLHWIRFDDLHKQLSIGAVMADSDILCAICRDGTSQTPNEIVICDVCNQGYHQRCHKPKIGDEILEPDVPWTCRLCVFALGTKEGGAEKNGNIGRALKHMKTELPYDLKDLHWDECHQTNRELTYCYCGGNGHYYSKMLQCSGCLQWFHEACIQALETPLLYGDHYYTFKCSVCSKGKEQLKRIIMKWSDMIALVINNLALQHQKRFFELSSDIVPFIQNNSNMLKMSEDIQKLTERELQDRISAVLKTNDNRFINGREVRKRAGQWALRMAFPFEKPLIFAPPFALQSSSTPTSPVSSPPLPSSCSPPEPQMPQKAIPSTTLMYGACRKGASKWPVLNTNHSNNNKKVQQKNSRSNSFSSSTGSNSCNASSVSISSRCSQTNTMKALKNKSKITIGIPTDVKISVKRPKSTNKRPQKKFSSLASNNSEDSSDTELISTTQIESLEAVIPVPKDFEGSNNPFSDLEHNPLKSRLSTGSPLSPRLTPISSIDSTQTTRISCKTESKVMSNPTEETTSDGKAPKMECYLDSTSNPRIDCKFNILAQRVKPDGKVEYLLEWQN